MSDWQPLIVALITAVPQSLLAYAAWRKGADAVKESMKTKAAVQEVHLMVNSRLTELLRLTEKSSLAEGVEQERIRGLIDAAGPTVNTVDPKGDKS